MDNETMLRELCDAVLAWWEHGPLAEARAILGSEPKFVTLARAYHDTVTGEA